MNMAKELGILLIVVLLVAIVFLAVGIVSMGEQAKVMPTTPSSGQTSSTGNTSPQQNPGQANPAAGWLTFTDGKNGFSFQYPASFGANVWRPTQWPPKATYVPAGQDPVAVGCPNLQSGSATPPVAAPGKTASGLSYSLYTGSDIGAGQLYSEYCYVIMPGSGSGAAVVDFVIQSHSACGFGTCGAYCGTQYESECLSLNRQQAIELPIQQMISTFVWTSVAAQTPVQFQAQTQPQPQATKTITMANNQTNVALHIGDTLLLQLGANYNWTIRVVDSSIVAMESGITLPSADQGIFKALKSGGTDLTAVGDPLCRAATPACGAPSVTFNIHVMVQ